MQTIHSFARSSVQCLPRQIRSILFLSNVCSSGHTVPVFKQMRRKKNYPFFSSTFPSPCVSISLQSHINTHPVFASYQPVFHLSAFHLDYLTSHSISPSHCFHHFFLPFPLVILMAEALITALTILPSTKTIFISHLVEHTWFPDG